MEQDGMQDGGLDDMMKAELANMAERDAEVEMVMAPVRCWRCRYGRQQ